MNLLKIVGPPGTGKTTYLLNMLEEELKRTPPERIAFVSFTRKGAYEGVDRALKRFNLNKEDVPYFRTLHSICYHQLGLTKYQIVGPDNYKELSDALGMPLSVSDIYAVGVPYTELASYLRACQLRLNNPDVFENFIRDFNTNKFRFVEKNYLLYKKQNGLMDFTDILYRSYIDQDPLPVDVAFIDEAQDLTTLQWEVVLKLFNNASRIYVAGDDDQGVYEWAGADIQRFIDTPSYKVLDHSHRLPRAVHQFAMEISSRIVGSTEKVFNPREEEGILDSANDWASVSVGEDASTLILARTHAELNRAEKWLRLVGMNYSKVERDHIKAAVDPKALRAIALYEQVRAKKEDWAKSKRLLELYKDYFLTLECIDQPWFLVYANQEEAAFIRRLLGRKQPIGEPNITLSTIHAAKGSESSHVVLALDFSYKTYKTWVTFMNSELRTYYVGVTRAKDRLTLKLKENTYGYPPTWG